MGKTLEGIVLKNGKPALTLFGDHTHLHINPSGKIIIGVAKPLSLFVETYGTEQGALTADDITNVIKIAFDCRPGAIAQSLALREPKYQETAAYCHFGREPYTKDGVKFFEWENTK